MSEESKDIFEQAAQQSIKDSIDKNKITLPDNIEQQELAEERTENPLDPAWVKMEKAMTGKFAERFINVMDSLPDKDFIRIYLKSLDFFKPKVVRQEPTTTEERNLNISVTLVDVNDEGDIIELDLNEEENTYE